MAIRNIRRDANKQADVEQSDKILTEDDLATCKEEIQTLTKQYEIQGQRGGRQEIGRDPGGLTTGEAGMVRGFSRTGPLKRDAISEPRPS